MTAYEGEEQVHASSDRQLHILRELSEQTEAVDSIHQAITELEKRLDGIIRNVDDDTAKIANEPRPSLVPIAEQLYEHNHKLRWARMRLISILDRLEL